MTQKEILIEEINSILKTKKNTELINFLTLLKNDTRTKPIKAKNNKVKIESKTDTLELIDDSGIVEKDQKNGKTRILIFKYKNNSWKLIIHSNSYKVNSYIHLLVSLDDEDWYRHYNHNIKNSYNLHLPHTKKELEKLHKLIIEEYKNIILKASESDYIKC